MHDAIRHCVNKSLPQQKHEFAKDCDTRLKRHARTSQGASFNIKCISLLGCSGMFKVRISVTQSAYINSLHNQVEGEGVAPTMQLNKRVAKKLFSRRRCILDYTSIKIYIAIQMRAVHWLLYFFLMNNNLTKSILV